MRAVLLLVLVSAVGLGSAQKLFFKSNKELEKAKAESLKGFGFKEPRQYFTSRLTAKDMANKLPVGAVVCPDKKAACPDRNTCCMMTTKGYGCCPLPNATCCLDRKHCCPQHSTCDVLRRVCVSSAGTETLWFDKVPALEMNKEDDSPVLLGSLRSDHGLESVICPDGEHECPDGDTCCKRGSGFGCCPKPNAVCCSDGVHCCPNGYTCDLTHSSCVKSGNNAVIDWLQRYPAKKRQQIALRTTGVKCDDKHECPTGNTCCKMGNGFGCCPLPNAECCSDHTHCCPHGKTCDTSTGQCGGGGVKIDWFEKQPAIKVERVQCDPTHFCENGNTCCKLTSGQWGCCPLPHALCCSDHTHCCPKGTTCDPSSGQCVGGGVTIDWFEKQPAQVVDVVQCDATHYCPAGNTCCKLPTGQWGCCPKIDAVCCSDHTHCCPHGTTCDTKSGHCSNGGVKIDWFEKQPAIKVERVQCDSSHFCENGNTCCKLTSGQWGCCPIPDAVCCSDGTHCCPSGTTCNTGTGSCDRGSIQTQWLKKQPARVVGEVQCDASHYCPSGDTCCKLPTGQWGCCPIPNAVCCSDETHCCPSGTTCNTGAGTCTQGSIQTQWLKKQPARVVGEVQCDASHYCPSGDTCCKLPTGQWGCCPIPNAVCCSDDTHCCPSGTTCNTGAGTCTRGSIQTQWLKKQPARVVGEVQCDASHYCPSGDTCCKLPTGQWGCCPIPNAVCCSDDTHCCPSGTTCNTGAGTCTRGSIQTQWLKKQPAQVVGEVQCDASHYCPSGDTCCKLPTGQWGCCPIPNAVCCSDDTHCCPSGTTCNTGAGTCTQGSIQTQWLKKQPARVVGEVQCDASHYCPSGDTCCKLPTGQWGCCPIPNAVCCSDETHCCPSGTTCNTGAGTCNKGSIQTQWLKKQPARVVGEVQCDASHYCPSGDTCCKLPTGQWGCCPIPNAVCCSDDTHCCPSGTTCNTGAGTCSQGSIQTQWLKKQPARVVGEVQCDASHYCPSGDTCCKLPTGQWGCCPIPNAVCCSDETHCCPSGTTCNTGAGTCNKGSIQTQWLKKQPARVVGEVQCDASHYCPSGDTCCKLPTGQWGCCPIPNAVCCSDETHCCPSGTTCNTGAGTCNKGSIQTQWLKKQPARVVGEVQCDASHYCPSGDTCCKLPTGQWGCCPIPNAVCCSDETHCCPSGTTCNTGAGTCNKGSIQTQWLKKQPARVVGEVQCDASHYCPSGDTCCKLPTGQWGCCPIPNAVCCSDDTHCCPSGTTCNTGAGTCTQGIIQTQWLKKQPARVVGEVQCDASHYCPSGDTCCKLPTGQWGCCPIPNAVCCSDDTHCCPSGTTCNTGAGTCSQGSMQTQWLKKQPARVVGEVQCDASHYCPSGNTCCKLPTGQWGCCPIPNAVCCSDDTHCCPSGTTCNTGTGSCDRGSIQTQWLKKQPARVVGEVQCDASHYCPSGNTCCKLPTGQWGCCPIPNAVCCSDGQHCCPHGYKCDVSTGHCMRGNKLEFWSEVMLQTGVRDVQLTTKKEDLACSCKDDQTCCTATGMWGCCPYQNAVCCEDGRNCCPQGTKCGSNGQCLTAEEPLTWIEKQPAQRYGSVECDDGTYCPDDNTCCTIGTGGYGCCPLPQAVCCSDELHCCPNGYTCETSSGQCTQASPQHSLVMHTMLDNLLMVICPDGSECQNTETCCKMDELTKTYGCCPLEDAVCCLDDQHCCPDGYSCDLKHGACVKGTIRVPWIDTAHKQEHVPKVQHGGAVGVVQCSDSVTCPDNYMCCPAGQDSYKCCPYGTGVCCNDKEHCCPHGYICDQGPDICRIPEAGQAVSYFLRTLQSKKAVPLI